MTFRILVSFGLAVIAGSTAILAQHEQHQAGAQASGPVAAQVAQCVQAQPVVRTLMEASLKRLEDARLTNDAAAMRDTADDLQSALIDIRTQLEPCAAMQAVTDDHAGHAMPTVQQSPVAPPGRPTTQPGSPVTAPGAIRPSTPAPARADPHAGHAVPMAPQPPSSRTPVQPPPSEPSISLDAEAHSGHGVPPATANPAASARDDRSTAPTPPTNIAELKCPNPVDPKTAPRALYQGRMYYFCTEAGRAEFAKDPSKFVTAPPQEAPAHAH